MQAINQTLRIKLAPTCTDFSQLKMFALKDTLKAISFSNNIEKGPATHI